MAAIAKVLGERRKPRVIPERVAARVTIFADAPH
jgi:hypothetical protein